MKKTLTLIVIVFFLAVSFATAAEKDDWWTNLKAKIENLAPAKHQTATTAAGGVRGEKTESESPYWKGKDTATADEVNDFKAALELAAAGKNNEAIAAFEEFLKNHPSSALSLDAKESLIRLKKK